MRPDSPFVRLRLKGLSPSLEYCINGEEEVYSGSTLMHAGYPLPAIKEDYQSMQLYLKAK